MDNTTRLVELSSVKDVSKMSIGEESFIEELSRETEYIWDELVDMCDDDLRASTEERLENDERSPDILHMYHRQEALQHLLLATVSKKQAQLEASSIE